MFSLKGKTNKEKRKRIYKFLLEHFTDEQRFNITSKLCLNILGRPSGFGGNGFESKRLSCYSPNRGVPESPGTFGSPSVLVNISSALPTLRRLIPQWPFYVPALFTDGLLRLDLEASELLSDTFEILSSKEIKLMAMRCRPDKDLLLEEDDMALANVVMQEAQKKIISQVRFKGSGC